MAARDVLRVLKHPVVAVVIVFTKDPVAGQTGRQSENDNARVLVRPERRVASVDFLVRPTQPLAFLPKLFRALHPLRHHFPGDDHDGVAGRIQRVVIRPPRVRSIRRRPPQRHPVVPGRGHESPLRAAFRFTRSRNHRCCSSRAARSRRSLPRPDARTGIRRTAFARRPTAVSEPPTSSIGRPAPWTELTIGLLMAARQLPVLFVAAVVEVASAVVQPVAAQACRLRAEQYAGVADWP